MTSIRTHIKLFWIVGAVLVIASSAPAHEKPNEKEVWAFRTHRQPIIDGVLDEEDWQRATPATGFISIEPEEGVAATNQTFIHVLYDADYLYIGLNMKDAEPGNIKGRIVQRDSPLAPLDLVGLVLDTYHDHQNAYGFYINAYGVQSDFRVENDGWGGIDSSWDAIWQAETHIHDQG